ncbi:unnamed protein product [Sphagnum balticum]
MGIQWMVRCWVMLHSGHRIPQINLPVRSLSCSQADASLPSLSAHRQTGLAMSTGYSGPDIICLSVLPQKHDQYAVGDFMTRREDLVVVEASTTVDEALELLVSHRITGLPVVDDMGRLVGVVSDYDLLALDSISGNRSRETETGLFPEPGRTWKAFKEIQKLLLKTHGKTVGEVMTPSPLVVRESTNLEDAARVLLDTKFRRLPVVDDAGKLVGLLTRGNVVRAALTIKQAADNNSAGGI